MGVAGEIVLDGLARGATRGATHFVADAVDQHLPHIRAQRAVAAVLESLQMGKRLEESILHDIGRVDDATHLSRQSPTGEPSEFRAKTCEERVERVAVTSPRAHEQPDRRDRRLLAGGHPARGWSS